MATSSKRIYWDACSWISVIQDEVMRDEQQIVVENRGREGRAVIAAAQKNILEIATSAFSLVEVCKKPAIREGQTDAALRDFFENPYVLRVNLGVSVGNRARQYMLSGFPGLKPPDAAHLASAVICRAEEFHTYDNKLLNLSNKLIGLDGSPLLICKPRVPPNDPAPLLDAINHAPISPPPKGH